METLSLCPLCPAPLASIPDGGLQTHLESHHLGRGHLVLWPCPHCRFAAYDLHRLVQHSLLFSHSLSSVKARIVEEARGALLSAAQSLIDAVRKNDSRQSPKSDDYSKIQGNAGKTSVHKAARTPNALKAFSSENSKRFRDDPCPPLPKIHTIEHPKDYAKIQPDLCPLLPKKVRVNRDRLESSETDAKCEMKEEPDGSESLDFTIDDSMAVDDSLAESVDLNASDLSNSSEIHFSSVEAPETQMSSLQLVQSGPPTSDSKAHFLKFQGSSATSDTYPPLRLLESSPLGSHSDPLATSGTRAPSVASDFPATRLLKLLQPSASRSGSPAEHARHSVESIYPEHPPLPSPTPKKKRKNKPRTKPQRRPQPITDLFYDQMLRFLATGEVPNPTAFLNERQFRSMASLYSEVDGVLFHRIKDGKNRMVVKESEVQAVIAECHLYTDASGKEHHRRMRETQDAVSAAYFWTTRMRDAEAYYWRCGCARKPSSDIFSVKALEYLGQ